jgi:hypothetical protein
MFSASPWTIVWRRRIPAIQEDTISTSRGSSLWDLLQQEEFKDESVTSVGSWNHIGAWADSKRKNKCDHDSLDFLYLG